MGFTSLLLKITKQIQKLGTEKRERERMRLHGGRASRRLRRGLRRRSRSTTPAKCGGGRSGSVRDGRGRERARAQRLRRGLRRRGREEVEPFALGRGSEKAQSGRGSEKAQ
jgi:hypothetical protein